MTAKKPISILVADDEPAIRDLLHTWLENDGHHVACARNGHEAAALLDHELFDVVIADILMPDGDGLELIAESKRTHPRVRFVAISGGGRYIQGVECLKVATGLGAHAAVLKPFSHPQIADSIETVLA
ncbi:MAG TPA: response regulator [Opitutaceae bacterium]|nr:response regulator [Opitutaceae bacterium]